MSNSDNNSSENTASPHAGHSAAPRKGSFGGAAKEVGFFTLSKLNQHGAVGTLTPIILFGFVVVSALAMYKGIDDLLKVSRPDLAEGSLVRTFIFGIVFLVAGSMWATLELSLRTQKLRHRIIAFGFYIFLTLWSLGFGYGFWWSLLAGREATTNRLTAMDEAISVPIKRIETSANTLSNDVRAIAIESENRQTQEAERGGSCDNAKTSSLGIGPLARERYAITESVKRVTQRVDSEWVAPLTAETTKLAALQARVAGFDQGAGAEELTKTAFDEISKDAEAIGVRLSSLHESVIPSLQKELDDLATRMQPGSVCVDIILADKLTDLSDNLDAPPPSTAVPNLDFVHGAYATAYAFDRLWKTVFETVGAASNRVFRPGETTLELAGAAPPPVARPASDASRNDIIALVAAIVVELGIFVFTVISPRRPFEQADFARRARTPVQQRLLSAFKNFSEDNKVEARSAIDDLLLHTGNRRAYIISPSFRSGVSQSGAFIRDRDLEHRRQFIQNILIVLEEALAIDRTIRMGPFRRWMAETFPWLQTSRLFVEAAERLEKHGWEIRDEGDFRLHRVKRGELLEVLMMLREELQKEAPQDAGYSAAGRSPRRRPSVIDSILGSFSRSTSRDDDGDEDDEQLDDEELEDERPRRRRKPARKVSRNRSDRSNGPLAALREPAPSKSTKVRKPAGPAAQQAAEPSAPAASNGHDLNGLDTNADPFESYSEQEIIGEIDALSDQITALSRNNDTDSLKNQSTATRMVSGMLDSLVKRGLEVMPVNGLANPYWHEIINAVPSDAPLNTILAVHRHGFFDRDGKPMRYARVTVSNGQSPAPEN